VDILSIPRWYWIAAVVVSAYHTARGAWFQWMLSHQQNREAQRDSAGVAHVYSTAEIIVFRCVEDGLFFFVTSAAGFVALYGAYQMLKTVQPQAISVGVAAALVFLALFGILGVSGQLPHLLQQGKFLPK